MNPVDAANSPAELLTSLFSLEGQVAIITGGGAGLGSDLSLMFAAAGAHVVTADLNHDGAKGVADQIRGRGGAATALHVDVTDEASVIAMFDHVRRELGGVDVLINNVGAYPNKPILDVTVSDWEFVQDVNLKGTFLCTREALRQMKDLSKKGRIVNISSIASMHPALLGNASYCASKGGVNMFTKEVALEAAEWGINVNVLAPGGVLTETRAKLSASANNWRGPATQPGRFLLGAAPPWKHAACALFLASAAATHITGQVLVADGGFLIS
ncbi:MAG: SDR family NAD(P)-dependent oxidoreductase [Sphingomonadales bacterium]